jgi:hypothetical protein
MVAKVFPDRRPRSPNPEGEIIAKGGFIFYAQYNDQIVVGTVSLLKVSESVYEVSKMAVTQGVQ